MNIRKAFKRSFGEGRTRSISGEYGDTEGIDRRGEGRKPRWSIYAEAGNALDGVPSNGLDMLLR